jgi:AcrR family transcriptional regulator
MPKLSSETRSERRQLLIDAAWRCAAVRGFRDLTVDDVCAEAGVSKGAFYGYFEQKQDLLLALLDDDSIALDRELDRITRDSRSGVERVRRFAEAMLARGEDAARVQVRADLWADLLTEEAVRQRLASATQRRRELVRAWIEEAVESEELVAIPANALASILLALADGLMLHGALDAGAFRWRNIRRAIDVLLAGIENDSGNNRRR